MTEAHPLKKILFSFLMIIVATKSYGQEVDLTFLKFKVEEAHEWTNLFKRNDGWFGGDGIYSIPLNGVEKNGSSSVKTLFIFSDSMVEKPGDGKIGDSKMIHNATAVLSGRKPLEKNMTFYWNTREAGSHVFVPKTPNTKPGDYYWLGDGFVNQELDNSIFIFGYRIKQVGNGAFGFSEVGNTMIKIANDQASRIVKYEQKDTPFHFVSGGEAGSYGAGIYVNTAKGGAKDPDGYIYIYGVKGQAKKLLVARVLPKDFENFDRWRFWNGNTWSAGMGDAAVLTDRVSNELSVSQLPDGRYALIFQESGIGQHIGLRLGKSPIGPFGPVIRIWDCKPVLTEKGYFTYNAKAHPSLSAKGELLISYNVNSFDFMKDLGKDQQFYRPRFIRLLLED